MTGVDGRRIKIDPNADLVIGDNGRLYAIRPDGTVIDTETGEITPSTCSAQYWLRKKSSLSLLSNTQ